MASEFCEERDLETYSTAQRAIQSSKHRLSRYIENHSENFVPKMQLFVLTIDHSNNWS